MESIVAKISFISKSEGLSTLFTRALFAFYRRSIRPLLPADGHVMYAGIPVGRERKFGDRRFLGRFLPPDLRDNPIYEQALVGALNSTVRTGDRIVVVGGGEGITASLAAALAGQTGSVICFEGDQKGVEAVRRTARANGVLSRVECIYAIVGSNIGVFGDAVADTIVAPQDLPECDVLEMDCEGSEVQILRDMVIKPRVVAVETHGFNGASTALVKSILERRGYSVKDLGLAEPKDVCIGRDEHVLLGLMT